MSDSSQEQVQDVAQLEREGVTIETLGLILAEGKVILKKVQAGNGLGAGQLCSGPDALLARFGPVQLLRMYRLQPRHELAGQKLAERKGYRAVAMGIDVLAIDFHFGAMVKYSLNHRGHLG